MIPPSYEKLPFKFHYMKNAQAWQTDTDGDQDNKKILSFVKTYTIHNHFKYVYVEPIRTETGKRKKIES